MTSLFKLSDIETEASKEKSVEIMRSGSDATLDNYSDIGIDGPVQYAHLMSRGKISLHNVIETFVKKFQPCKVWLTTWAISENPVRSIVNLLQSGAIKELNCVFNYRVNTECPKAYQLAQFNFANIKLSKIHAKVVVIEAENGAITIVSSANLTANPRIEVYTITNDLKARDFHLSWIKEEMNANE